MIDLPTANKLADEALDHWQAGRLSEAAGLYAQAVEFAEPNYYTADLHSAFAGVLAALGRDREARAQYEAAIANARQLTEGDDLHFTVTVHRYFLADHLVRHGAPALALEAIAPSLAGPTKDEWYLRLVEAEALFALGQSAEAQSAARLCLEKTRTGEKRAELAKRFADLGLR